MVYFSLIDENVLEEVDFDIFECEDTILEFLGAQYEFPKFSEKRSKGYLIHPQE